MAQDAGRQLGTGTTPRRPVCGNGGSRAKSRHSVDTPMSADVFPSYKDQELETAFAKRLGVPLLLANVTQQVYQMARAQGLNKQDGSAIVKVFEKLAGVTVRGEK